MSLLVEELVKWALLASALLMPGSTAEHVIAAIAVAGFSHLSSRQHAAAWAGGRFASFAGSRFVELLDLLRHPLADRYRTELEFHVENISSEGQKAAIWCQSLDMVRFCVASLAAIAFAFGR